MDEHVIAQLANAEVPEVGDFANLEQDWNRLRLFLEENMNLPPGLQGRVMLSHRGVRHEGATPSKLYLTSRLCEERCRSHASEILLVIEYLDHQTIVYRDLKPENIRR